MGSLGVLGVVALQIVPLVVAIVLHELAHGHTARLCGDHTAERAGRLSLNPLRHLDPVGSFLVPAMLALGSYAAGVRPVMFGWARPVPVDAANFRHPRRDMVLVALAGPAANGVIALGAAAALAAAVHSPVIGRLGLEILAVTVVVNCILGVFNLLPVPPLDGGRVLQAALPRSWARHLRTLDGVGMVVVVLLVMQTNVVGVLARPVIDWLLSWAG